MSAPLNTPKGTQDRGGYCWLHDKAYLVVQGDEVCPRCENNYLQDLAWRDAEDVNYHDGDMGDSDEE